MNSVASSVPEVLITVGVGLVVAYLLGGYLARVFLSRPTMLDSALTPLDNWICRGLGVNQYHDMRWQEYATALLMFNLAGGVFVYALLTLQGGLPGNALGAPSMSWDLALHTSVAFMTNTDFQHYTPETQVSLLSSILGLLMLMFLSAGTGLTVAVAFTRGFVRRNGRIGNFYADIVKSMTRVFLPLALLGALIFVMAGVPQTLAQSVSIYPITGGHASVPIGPVAAWDSIEFLGTNGGGYFAANAAHPFQDPSALTNVIAVLLMMAIPFSTPFMFGDMVRRKGESRPLFIAVLVVFMTGLLLFIYFQSGNPFLAGTGVGQGSGYFNGAETRFTIPESSLFQVTSIFDNVGATSMSLGALTPGAQTVLLWGMFLQATPGGVGTGFGLLLINALLAIFIGGLMVGRTPEYLGKKIGRDQMRWATVTILSHPFAILIPLAVAYVFGFATAAAGTGPHAFTVVLYEFTSESANNGSGMGPIQDATPFFNVVGALIMLVGRYLPILAMLAIGGSLAGQDPLPAGPGTIKTDSVTFTIYLILFMTIVTGLLFLPVLVMGPFSQGALGG